MFAGLIGRQQWMGFKDESGQAINPRTIMFFAESPIHIINSGLAVMAYTDRIGYDKNSAVRLNYAYHMKFMEIHQISFGVALDFQQQVIDLSLYDIRLPGEQRSNAIDMGSGIFYRNKNGMYAGFSLHNLLGAKKTFDDLFTYNNSLQWQLVAGTGFNLVENRNFVLDLLPSLLVSGTSNSPQVLINTTLVLNKNYFAGLAYRYQDAVILLGGLSFAGFRLGLSYDFTLSNMRKAGSNGSPEVFLSYSMPMMQKIKWKSMYNTREL